MVESNPATGALSFTGARWSVPLPGDGPEPGRGDFEGIPFACLQARGLEDPEQAASFLRPSEADFLDPSLLLGMDVALARVRRALADRERVRVVTDYDVDGTTSSLVLRATLGALGFAEVDGYIPDRFADGYGFNPQAARRCVEDGVKLVLAADVGIRDHEAISLAREGGVDVIVCDHHLSEGEDVPRDAAAILCPGRPGDTYPHHALAAVGVSFKLAQALLVGHPRERILLGSLLKLVALGTVADVMDLSVQENRAFVSLGLAAMERGPNSPGLAALLEVAGCTGRRLGAEDMGFRLGPRINAAGRIEHARLAVDLLLARDPVRARELAREIDALNTQRKSLQAQLVHRILTELRRREAKGGAMPLFPVLAGPEADGWHPGIVGIVASKVRETLFRPVAVVSIREDIATGSIRSIPGVNAVHALDSAAGLLVRYGGHAAAAGFSVPEERIPELEARLSDYVARTAPPEALIPLREAEIALPAHTLDPALASALARLAPFGRGNPEPVLVVTGVTVESPRVTENGHLFFRFGDRSATWWGGGAHLPALQRGPVDLLGTWGEETWQGRTRHRFLIEDARSARASSNGASP